MRPACHLDTYKAITLFFDSLDTQKVISEFSDDDFS